MTSISFLAATAMIWFIVIAGLPNDCSAILPTAAIDIQYTTDSGNDSNSRSPIITRTLLASQASFGTYPAMGRTNNNNKLLTPVFPPEDDDLLMCSYDSNARKFDPDTIVLVPRGNCTFEQKAVNAQKLGASAIVIYGTLGSRYAWNESESKQIWPYDKFDYDCNYGSATVDISKLKFNPSYDATFNDALLTGSTSLCSAANPNFTNECTSQRCLLTGNTTSTTSSTIMKACCAWDLHVWLYNDPSFDNVTVNIPAFYITMTQFGILKDILSDNASSSVSLIPYSRPRPAYNASAFLIWALGIFVAWLASYLSAQEYRQITKKTTDAVSLGNSDQCILYTELVPGEAEEDEEPISASSSSSNHPRSTTNSSRVVQESTNTTSTNHQAYGEETLELTWHHAVAFLIMSSTSLFVLFFFKLYAIVKVMYGIGCSGALVQVIFLPLYTKLYQTFYFRKNKSHTNGGGSHHPQEQIVLFTMFEEQVTLIDVLSFASGYGIGISWIVVGFMVQEASAIPFYWITQDIMGACMCIVFLGIIRLNSIKVATILLVAAFIYDIFFVFITPLIFDKSIMITVATSGGPPTGDPAWCEKYPSDKDCQGGEPLPMLFAIPRIGDFEGGASLLGLGDVVLPGLLLSFACRIDCAKRLIGLKAGGSEGGYCHSSTGYFYPVLVAYAIGLLMANLAVYIMNMGQPALLYLVPMCLGTICTLGWVRNEMTELWNGPKFLLAADQIVSRSHAHHSNVSANTHDEIGVSV